MSVALPYMNMLEWISEGCRGSWLTDCSWSYVQPVSMWCWWQQDVSSVHAHGFTVVNLLGRIFAWCEWLFDHINLCRWDYMCDSLKQRWSYVLHCPFHPLFVISGVLNTEITSHVDLLLINPPSSHQRCCLETILNFHISTPCLLLLY